MTLDDPIAPDRFRVLVVDDHDVVHWGFRLMLGELPWVERCFSARNSSEAFELARRHEPHIALVDLFVGDESGPDICERLHVERPGLRVLLISGAGRISAPTARACGAHGFVPKDWPAADIARAVRMVGLGMTVFDEGDVVAPAGPGLSEREQDVLSLVATGATNREIAAELYITVATVETHLRHAFQKLGVRARTQLPDVLAQKITGGP